MGALQKSSPIGNLNKLGWIKRCWVLHQKKVVDKSKTLSIKQSKAEEVSPIFMALIEIRK